MEPIDLHEYFKLSKKSQPLPTKHKFNAKPTTIEGKYFPSKLEALYYKQLLLRQQSGDVIFFLRQPIFDLPGGTQYRADFVVYLASGEVEFIDVKGKDLATSRAKRKMVEDLYPVKIKLVKSV